MKNSVKFIIICCISAILIVSAGLTAFAATSNDNGDESQIVASDDSTFGGKAPRGRPDGNIRESSFHVNVISVAASVLGKTEDEIKEAIKEGKLGDLLIAENKLDGFKTAYLAEVKLKLDAAVTDGTLTQTEADEKYVVEQEKMEQYDGSEHLCGGKDHSKMFEKKSRSKAEVQRCSDL